VPLLSGAIDIGGMARLYWTTPFEQWLCHAKVNN
jgi:hypothetical protein